MTTQTHLSQWITCYNQRAVCELLVLLSNVLREKETTDKVQPMAKQFSARGVKVVASGTFSSNYVLEYIRKIPSIKELEVSFTFSWGARMVQW